MSWKSQNNFIAGVLSPVMFGRVELPLYRTGLSLLENFKVMAHGGVTNRSGTLFGWEVKDSTKTQRLINFEYNDDTSYVIEAGALYFRFGSFGSLIEDGGSPVELVTPYLEDELADLKFTQSADVLWITHKNHSPRRLERTSSVDWTLAPVTFIDGAYLLTNSTGTTMYASANTGNVVVTASSIVGINKGVGFSAGDVGRLIRIFDDTGSTWGWGDITAVTSPTVVDVTIVAGKMPLVGDATTVWKLGKWTANPDAELGFPSACTLHQQRMAYAGTPGVLQDIDLSQVDLTAFFGQALDDVIVASDAIGLRLTAGNLNAIRWLASIDKGLAIGTSGGVWLLTGAEGKNTPVTPLSFYQSRKSTEGSASLNGIPIGNIVLYLSRNGRRIHEFAYVFEDDGYDTPDLSVLAEHLTKTYKITSMDYQDDEKILWCIRADGTLLGFTYMRKNGVLAWHTHVTDGLFENVVCVKEGDVTTPYFVVKRFIDGAYKKYVEYFPADFSSEETADAYFVDSGVNYNDPKAIVSATEGVDVVLTVENHGYTTGDIVDIFNIPEVTKV